MPDYRPGVASPSAATRHIVVWTMQDFVHLLVDRIGVDRSSRPLRLARLAVINAQRDLPYRHNWSHYFSRFHVNAEAEFTTGTIAYDHTGSANEREVTLSGGTWPTNAKFGYLVIANQHYEVEQRISDTILTLTAENNPGADIAGGTSFTWYRDNYLLPINYARMSRLYDPANIRPLDYIEPTEFMEKSRLWRTPSTPHCYTIMHSPEHLGALSLYLGPAPSTAQEYDALYQREPNELRTEEEVNGTVTVSAGATSVTGTGTSFSQEHIGSIIRFSDNGSQEPNPFWGDFLDEHNPYFAQRVIQTVPSSTSLTIDSEVSASTTLTDVKFSISDPIDVRAGAMMTAFQKLAEYHFAELMKMDDAGDRFAMAERTIQMAIANDAPTVEFYEMQRQAMAQAQAAQQ